MDDKAENPTIEMLLSGGRYSGVSSGIYYPLSSYYAFTTVLVSRQASNVGYSLDSLMRASSVVNCQLILALS